MNEHGARLFAYRALNATVVSREARIHNMKVVVRVPTDAELWTRELDALHSRPGQGVKLGPAGSQTSAHLLLLPHNLISRQVRKLEGPLDTDRHLSLTWRAAPLLHSIFFIFYWSVN